MKFSITIPAYKRTYLKECIESILAQSYKDFELIIVNDASPEDLDSVVNEFNDKRIRYYTNEKNCGAVDVVDNWNICLGYAKGDYIICMGDDDMLAPNALEEYNRLINKYPNVDLFHSRVKQIDENGNFIKMTSARPEWESVLSMIWHRMEHRQQYIGDYLFKTKKLNELGGFYKLPYAWASDDITSYLVAKDNGCAHTNQPTFCYRINSQTITQSGNTDIKMKALIQTDSWYHSFIKDYIPENLVDNYHKIMILNNLSKYSKIQKIRLISNDMLKSVFNIFHWIKYKNDFELSFIILAYSCIEYYKLKRR